MGCSVNTQLRTRKILVDQPRLRKNSTKPEISVKPGNFVLKNENWFTNVYRLGQLLGIGYFGEVRLCTNRKTNEKFAVKIIKKDSSQSARNIAIKEIEIMKTLDHPNIIRIFEYFESLSKIHIVLEYCSGGELLTKIVNNNALSERHAMKIISNLLCAISYLHENHIVHRDIKPENILFEDNKEYSAIKLIDFGLAINTCEDMTDKLGSVHYMSPEVVSGKYNGLCDV